MARTDEGEFELVLGNRQLISVFLIVVILLGVFFSMGYIVGRNSAPVVTADNTHPPGKPIVVPPASSQPSNTAASSNPQDSSPPPSDSKAAETKPVETHAEQPAAKSSAPPPAPPKEEKPSPVPPPERTAATGDPPAGDYWQVVATRRPDAEIVSEALARKGFHAVIAPGPSGLFRVLVGPLKDGAAKAQTRTDLEAAGFKNPMVRKY